MASAAGSGPNYDFMFQTGSGATSGNDVIDQLQQIQQFMAQQTGLQDAGHPSSDNHGGAGNKNPEIT